MPRRRLFRIGLVGVAALLVTAVVLVLGTGTFVVRRPYPEQDGAVSLPGLSGEVTVLRDERGIPHVYADTPEDLFRGQGYVQAQDRFFEMDWRRHVTAGRLSELTGPNEAALAADKVVRTLGWRRVAEQELQLATPSTRRYLDAFSQGVNDYVAGRTAGELSVNYTVLGLNHPLPAIEKWSPVDSISWFKAMAWDLRGNYDDEIVRARTYPVVKDVERIEQLFPDYPYDRHAPIIPSAARSGASSLPRTGPSPGGTAPARTAGTAAPSSAPREVLAALGSGGVQGVLESASRAVGAVPRQMGSGEGVGSNSWVVSGELSATGKPLLANDPHLAPSIPGIWYQMGLHCRRLSAECPFDVSGFTFSGVPGVVIGHTNRIAWGITNLGPDVTDFYLERLDGERYLIDGERRPLETRTETIQVAGADPVKITVRSTGHGPLLSDVLEDVRTVGARAPVAKGSPARGPAYAVSLAWTALTAGRDMDAIFAVNTATDFASFRRGALLLDVPAQNFVYADIDGHIGYQAPGRIPIRVIDPPPPTGTRPANAAPTDGTWPLPGWDSRYTWKTYVDPEQLPWVLDPEEGFIVAANQPVTGTSGAVRFTDGFDYGYRSQRIRDLIAGHVQAGRRVQVGDMEDVQVDSRNGLAPVLVPSLLKEKVDPFTQEALDLLKDWQFDQPEDSAAAAYYNAVWATLLDLTFADEMPVGTRPDGGARWAEAVRALLKEPTDPWWDDRRTPNVLETRNEIISRALVDARLELTRILGKDPGRWQWGRLHRLRLVQQPLGGLGITSPVHPLLNRGPLDMPGGSATVNALAWDAASDSFDVTWAPSMRMVVDMSALDRSRWVNQTGQSGHPGHGNYADQLDAWRSGESFPWPFSEAAVRAATAQTLTLRPAGS